MLNIVLGYSSSKAFSPAYYREKTRVSVLFRYIYIAKKQMVLRPSRPVPDFVCAYIMYMHIRIVREWFTCTCDI